MKTKRLFKCLMLASIIPFSTIMIANDDLLNEEKQVIDFNNNINNGNNNTLQVPVTATLSNNVLNVQFTGSVPMATVTVSNAMTGATISQQSSPAVNGTVTSVPVAGITMGTVTVTNKISGQSVSGEFAVADRQE